MEVRIASTYLPPTGALRDSDKSFCAAIKYELEQGYEIAGHPYLLPQTDQDWPRICVLMIKR
jgi:hypothetical protein